MFDCLLLLCPLTYLNIDEVNRKSLYSTSFYLGYGYPSFYLQLYPNGYDIKNKDYVSLFLCCSDKPSTELPVKWEFSLINKDGKHVNIFKFNRTFSEAAGWGFPEFIDRSKLLDPSNGLLVNDQLKVHCQVNFSYENRTSSLYIHPSNFQKHLPLPFLEKTLDSGNYSDVILSVEGIDIPAHKIILCAQSAVFESMFDHKETKEAQEGKVIIEDVDVDTFKVLLKYFYSGQIPDAELLTEELLVVSEKYLVNTLKLACEGRLLTKLTINSAAEMLLFADTHNASILRAKCLPFIADNAAEVRLTDGWKTIVKIRPELVDKIFELFVSKTAKEQKEQEEQEE